MDFTYCVRCSRLLGNRITDTSDDDVKNMVIIATSISNRISIAAELGGFSYGLFHVFITNDAESWGFWQLKGLSKTIEGHGSFFFQRCCLGSKWSWCILMLKALLCSYWFSTLFSSLATNGKTWNVRSNRSNMTTLGKNSGLLGGKKKKRFSLSPSFSIGIICL